MDRKILVLLILGVAVASLTVGYSLGVAQRRIASSGIVKAIGIEVYADQACTVKVSEISWGTLSPGDSANRTIYVRNTGNTVVTLSMEASGWDPASASDCISLSWNLEGESLGAGSVKRADLLLTVSPSVSGVEAFSFTITIKGSG